MTVIREGNLLYKVLSDNTVGVGGYNSSELRNAIPDGETCPYSLVIPPYINNNQYEVTEILTNSLRGCAIHHIELPETLKYIRNMGMSDLYIKELIIPSSVEVLERYSISGMKKCKRIVFVLGSKIKEIGFGSMDRNLIETIVIPNTVEIFSTDIFYACKNLKTIYMCATNIKTKPSGILNGAPENINIYVPSSYKEDTFDGRPVTKVNYCGYIMPDINRHKTCNTQRPIRTSFSSFL